MEAAGVPPERRSGRRPDRTWVSVGVEPFGVERRVHSAELRALLVSYTSMILR